MLDDWFISLEEVPFYLYQQMGIVAIQEAIAELRSEPLSSSQLVHLDTVEYWADIADTEDFGIITQRIIEKWD